MADRVTEDELKRIYNETIVSLYGFASRRCGGRRELAEDVTQETWLRAVREWRQHGLPNNPLGWLTTVARNLIYNMLRRRESISLDSVSPAEVHAAVEANTLDDSVEIASVISQSLSRLPEAEAKLLEGFHYDRCKVAQLAQLYGISERAVEGRLRRARERLRREIDITLKGERGFT